MPAPSSSDTVRKGKMTCYYWANEISCTYSAEDCKYHHEYLPGVPVAAKPYARGPTFMRRTEKTWRRAQSDKAETDTGTVVESIASASGWAESVADPEAEVEGDFVLEEIQVQPDGWNTPIDLNTGWAEIQASSYKTPHVRALEEKVQKQEVGW